MYIQFCFFSLLFLSSLVFFILTTLALLPLTIPATNIFLTSGLKSFKGMFNKPFPLLTVSLDFFCVSFFGGCDDPSIIAILLSSVRDLFGISVALSFLRVIVDASLVSEKKSSETDKDKDKDRSTGKETKTKRNTSPGRGSTHRDQSTGNFKANTMIQCINEIKQVKAEAAAKGKLPKVSRNKIQAKQYLYPLLPR